jgi:DNA polymerase-3 subunit alpha
VYQEQMMQIARNLAGYTLAEADTLRKAIGKKIKSLLDEQREKLINGMIKNGIDMKTAKSIWDLFPPFARYGFNRSHAACYALIGYRTAYLKAHYPIEFTASLLNAEVHDIDRISFLIGEARKDGFEILPPDINKSFVSFVPEGDKIRFGLLAIKNVGEHITQVIIEERTRNGQFQNLTDFLLRIQDKDLNKKSLESLIKGGAFDSMGVERGQLIGNFEEILKFNMIAKKSGGGSNHSLFGPSVATNNLKLKDVPPSSTQEKLIWEKELLGFYLSDHPLNSYRERITKTQAKPIAEAALIKDETKIFRVAGLISRIHKVTTKKGQQMLFVTIQDFSPVSMEIVVFSSILDRTQQVWQDNKVVLVQGKISLRGEDPKMICDAAMVLEV